MAAYTLFNNKSSMIWPPVSYGFLCDKLAHKCKVAHAVLKMTKIGIELCMSAMYKESMNCGHDLEHS